MNRYLLIIDLSVIDTSTIHVIIYEDLINSVSIDTHEFVRMFEC